MAENSNLEVFTVCQIKLLLYVPNQILIYVSDKIFITIY